MSPRELRSEESAVSPSPRTQIENETRVTDLFETGKPLRWLRQEVDLRSGIVWFIMHGNDHFIRTARRHRGAKVLRVMAGS